MEIYSDLYYKTNFAEQVHMEFEKTIPDSPESKQESSARKMNIYRKWRELSWVSESEEVKAHVHQVYEDEHIEGDSDDSSDEAEWKEVQRRQR